MSGETTLNIVGNLTSDPELRYTQTGLAVANFTIASTPREYDRASSEWKDGNTLYLRCTVWREYAENVAHTLSKGSRVIAVGVLHQRAYETKEGEKRSTFEFEVSEIGPALRYARADVHKIASQSQESAASDKFPTRASTREPAQV